MGKYHRLVDLDTSILRCSPNSRIRGIDTSTLLRTANHRACEPYMYTFERYLVRLRAREADSRNAFCMGSVGLTASGRITYPECADAQRQSLWPALRTSRCQELPASPKDHNIERGPGCLDSPISKSFHRRAGLEQEIHRESTRHRAADAIKRPMPKEHLCGGQTHRKSYVHPPRPRPFRKGCCSSFSDVSSSTLSAILVQRSSLTAIMSSYTPQHTQFTHPAHLEHLPAPQLEFLFHLECERCSTDNDTRLIAVSTLPQATWNHSLRSVPVPMAIA